MGNATVDQVRHNAQDKCLSRVVPGEVTKYDALFSTAVLNRILLNSRWSPQVLSCNASPIARQWVCLRDVIKRTELVISFGKWSQNYEDTFVRAVQWFAAKNSNLSHQQSAMGQWQMLKKKCQSKTEKGISSSSDDLAHCRAKNRHSSNVRKSLSCAQK